MSSRSSRLTTGLRAGSFAATALVSLGLAGQCANDNALNGAALNIPCPGSLTVPCMQGGQYALVNVITGNIYTFSTCTGGAYDTQITLYNNAGGASLGYNDDACGGLGLQSSVSWTATYTGQLRVLVDQYNCLNNAGCMPLTLSCAAPPPPVTNNNPCQAISLAVNPTCVPSTFSNAGANLTTTPVIPAPGCGNLVAGSADVWFTFVAPPSGIAVIETGAGTLTDGAMALYTATACGGTYNLVECSDDEVGLMPFLAFDNLTPGNTYYLRVWGYGAATGTFSVCIHGPTSLPAGDCVYLLQLEDSFGDGWGGSYVSVSINGIPQGTFTCNNLFNAFLFGVDVGDVIVIGYTVNGGLFQGENSYALTFLSTAQNVFTSGSPPVAGNNVFFQTVTCTPPPAAPEDCLGGTTLCNGQGINNNTNSTGNVEDLNSSNYGCLLASEQQGTWYNFSVSSSGTLGMIIDPSGNDDYDWAVWGPYPPGSTTVGVCPPLATPVRCSFASGLESVSVTGSYNTGMGTPNAAWANPQFAAPLPAYSDPAGGGDGWTPGINVLAGQVFLLYVSNFSLSGQSFNLSWQLGAGASLDCTVLPIELTRFTGACTGAAVQLEWTTASEQNTSHFTVWRARSGSVDFEAIGTVAGQGSTQSVSEYRLLDQDPHEGINHYKLVATDVDGASSTSDVIAVHHQAVGSGAVFPQPATDDIWWSTPTGKGLQRVVIFDAVGRAIREVDPRGVVGSTVHLDLRGLPDGTYLLAAFDVNGLVDRAPFLKR